MKTALVIFSLFFAAALLQGQPQNAVPVQPAATDAPYGFHAGTVSGSVGAGAVHLSGVDGLHPGVVGSMDVGVSRYVGFFVEGGWTPMGQSASACYYGYCASASARANFYDFGGGVEIVATNRSRVVPYFKLGAAYAGGSESAYVSGSGVYANVSASASAPAVLAGGGVRTYINRHVGVDTRISLLRTLPSGGGGGWAIAPTVGVFFQSR